MKNITAKKLAPIGTKNNEQYSIDIPTHFVIEELQSNPCSIMGNHDFNDIRNSSNLNNSNF